MYELNACKIKYKSIYLDSETATIDSARKVLVFNNLPLIQVRGDYNILKIKGITLNSSNTSNFTGHTWDVRLENVKYNGQSYFNSDAIATPIIARFLVDSVRTYQEPSYLEIDKQDINNLTLNVISDHGHGLTKNSTDIKMFINIEIEEHYY